jgi:glycerol-3-phosphate dehydrogenase subunit C
MTEQPVVFESANAADGLAFAGHQLSRASLDACIKCTICEAHCPVAAVTPLFSGPKFAGPQAERFRSGSSVDQSIDYCSSCGTCTLVCPQGVQIAELNSQARAVMKADHMPIRDRLIGQTTLMGKVMTPVAPVAKAALRSRPIRAAMEAVVGVHRDAPMPTPQAQSFEGWFRKRGKPTGPFPRGPVVFFHGCAGGYFEVETSKKSVEVLEYLGFEVLVPKQGCCGLAQQSNGLFAGATKSVLKLCDDLRSAGEGLTIISSSGSCTGMLKHEAHEILGVSDDRLTDVATRIRDIMEFLLDLHEAAQLPTDFEQITLTVPYHAPCQLKSQGMGKPALELLKLIPGLDVVDSEATCCGIAGTYGLKKEKYDVAQAVGKPLFDMVKATSSELALCDTETCRWQIEKATGVRTEHPIAMIHAAYGLGALLPRSANERTNTGSVEVEDAAQ